MDRIGIFAAASSLVVLSALHMLHAPNYLNVIPAALLIGGAARLLLVRPVRDADADLALAPAAEA